MPRRGRGHQLLRLLTILDALSASRGRRRLSADELWREICERLELPPEGKLHKRTIYRDLALLQGPKFGWVKCEKNRYTVSEIIRGKLRVAATLGEMLSVHLALRLLAAYRGTPVTDGLKSLWKKFRPFLSAESLALFEDLTASLIFKNPHAAAPVNAHIVKLLFLAIQKRMTVKLRYQPILWNQPYEGYYDPYGLVFFDDTLYLVAESHYNRDKGTKESVVSLKVARISTVELINRTFAKKDGIDFEDRLAGALGVYTGGKRQEYRIRLTAFAGRLIAESPWHASQKIVPDGTKHHILSLTLDNTIELTPRILALGAAAEVLEPPAYRQEIAGIIQRLAEIYPKTSAP